MVWALTPTDAVRGTQEYFVFAAGTYKVGRKDCDVVVQTDTSISRVHAEIAVEKMAAWDSRSGAPPSPSYVRVIDRSKYGTFVNKRAGAEGGRLQKDEDVMLKDGDTVTFGTGNASFRLSFVPMVAFLHGRKPARSDPSLQATLTAIGAHATRKWSEECTHVIVDGSCSLTPQIIDAVLAKKQIILGDWFKVMAEKNIHTEIPSYTQYTPNLTLDGTEIKMEAKLIENCLAGYTFVMGSSDKYKFGEKLQGLLELAGAKSLHIDEFCANSQNSAEEDIDKQILLVPAISPLEFNKIRELFPLSKITDVKLLAAILSGHLEVSVIEPPAFIVTSSHSTDETIVADSDVEVDTATSYHTATEKDSQRHVEPGFDDKKEITTAFREAAGNLEERKGSFKELEKVGTPKPMMENVLVIDKVVMSEFKSRDADVRVIDKLTKDGNLDTGRNETCDVTFSQDLIVKAIPRPAVGTSTEIGGINFKRFRKRETVSGNSFRDLIPFAREPYKESDHEYNKSTDFIREEKKRKQMEAIAEDLFNNSKAKKRAAGTSIHTLLTGR